VTAQIPLPKPWPARLAAAAIALATLPALADDSPFARYPAPPSQLMNGVWNGVDLERRSGCANTQNDGTRGTYAQFTVGTDASGLFSVQQLGITGLTCTYGGHYTVADGAMGIDGTYSCSDGKQGDFHATKVDVNGNSLTVQMHVQLTGSETCSIDAILGMSRFYP
jgi:hypothetical protein